MTDIEYACEKILGFVRVKTPPHFPDQDMKFWQYPTGETYAKLPDIFYDEKWYGLLCKIMFPILGAAQVDVCFYNDDMFFVSYNDETRVKIWELHEKNYPISELPLAMIDIHKILIGEIE